MRVLKRMSELLDDSLGRIFTIEKFEEIYILAIKTSNKKDSYTSFVSINKYPQEIHKSNVGFVGYWQSAQCISLALQVRDVVIRYSNWNEFFDKHQMEEKEILPKSHWIHYYNFCEENKSIK